MSAIFSVQTSLLAKHPQWLGARRDGCFHRLLWTMMPIWLMLQVLAHFTWPGAEITSCGTVGVLEVHTDIKWMPLDTTVTPPLHRCSKQGVHYN